MKGIEGFHQYFQEVYKDQWELIYSSLEKEEQKILRRVLGRADELQADVNLPLLEDHIWSNEKTFDYVKHLDNLGKKCFYPMDPASIIVALSLDINIGDRVLDMCAAPGGKSLVLAERIIQEGTLCLNEPSPPRRKRLKTVVSEYLPETMLERVNVIGMDGVSIGMKYVDSFNAILIDAPCSGERHMIKKSGELKKWSLKRSKRLAGTQYGLLCSALLAATNNACIVYSTCALSPLENDGVIEKLLKKKSDQFELVDVNLPEEINATKTKYGYLFTPEKCGFGPLYFTKLVKK